MTSLIRSLLKPSETRSGDPLSMEQWAQMFAYNNGQFTQTLAVANQEEIGGSFQGQVDGAYKRNGIVFACITARMLLFSEARFQFQRMRGGRPGNLYGLPTLSILEEPWPNGTTGDLLSRALQDADLAGNFYCHRPSPDRLTRMRPDWVTIMLGSERSDWEPGDLDTEVIGYLYHPGGKPKGRKPIALLPESVAHFAPIPDPTASYRGMSWLSPIVTEIMGDKAAIDHKLKFFEHGATVSLVATLDPAVKEEAFKRWVAMFKAEHEGALSAYKTVFLGGGADLKAIGSDMKQIDFKAVIGAGETRVCAAARVPPIIVGLSEGLQSATYSLPYDGSVWTCVGPRPIGDLRAGDMVWTRINGQIQARPVTWQGCTGKNAVFTVRTKNRSFRATGNHPVLTPDGSWRNVEDLNVGDRVLAPLGLPDLGGDRLPNGQEATGQIMQWLGAFTGDGCLNGTGSVRMCLPAADRVRGFYEDIPSQLFTKGVGSRWESPGRRAKDGHTPEMVRLRTAGLTFRQIRDEMGLTLHPMSVRDRVNIATRQYVGEREPVVTSPCRHGFQFHSREAVAWHHEMGVTGGAKTKRVPGWIFGLREDLRLAYLAGVVDTDGSIGKDGRLVIHFASRGLVEDVRMLLVSCGIQCCNIAEYRYTQAALPNPGIQEEYISWRFTVSSAHEVARIPFADTLYRERVEAHAHRYRPNKAGAFRIRSIERGTAEPVYDIEVQGGHSFLTDGVIVHNSNYASARRAFADLCMRPLWRNMAGSMAAVVPSPSDSRLWYDSRDVAFLQEDTKDEADIQQTQAISIKQLVEAGFTPESVVDAVTADDLNRLVHTGLLSVQLFEATAGATDPATNGAVPALNGKNGRRLLQQFVGNHD